jgi:hypothetical protein|tara:strand:+ start:367 stop:750 length:384 start_codon:yes stop_codon:yes gene_type:complete
MKFKTYKNPTTLTPNQTKWLDRYLDKSGDTEDLLEPPNEYHEVYEWENGWIDYTVDDEIFWIWSIYSNKPDANLGMVESFKIATKLAKQKKCQYIDWDTRRPFNAWKRLTKNIGKLRIITRQLRIEL